MRHPFHAALAALLAFGNVSASAWANSEVPPVPPPVEVKAERNETVVDGIDGKKLCALFAQTAKGHARDQVILGLTPAEYARMKGADAVCLASLISSIDSALKFPDAFYARLSGDDVGELLKVWTNAQLQPIVMKRWIDVQRAIRR